MTEKNNQIPNAIFFTDNNTKEILQRYKINLQKSLSNSPPSFPELCKEILYPIIESMIASPNKWERNCQVNIKEFSQKFLEELEKSIQGGVVSAQGNIGGIIVYCFFFLNEMVLSSTEEIPTELEKARIYILENTSKLPARDRQQIQEKNIAMPIRLLRKIMETSGVEHVAGFKKLYENAQRERTKWNEELKAYEQRANNLKKSFEETGVGYNFAGLYNGFNNLSKNKKNELNATEKSLQIFGALTVAPFLAELVLIHQYWDKLSDLKEIALFTIFPTISLTAIFVYFFRIVLSRYRSLSSQLLQIELRKTLCQFIQSYADYSSELQSKGGTSLEKFENIIFSGIVMDAENLPTTFDGIEQLGNLIKSIKSK